MESDKLRGEYKKAMETIDLSKDSRDRILSNIRLEDLSVPAANVKVRKKVPLFVIIPIAGAAFAVLIIGGFLLGMGDNLTKNAAVPALEKDEQLAVDEVDSVSGRDIQDDGGVKTGSATEAALEEEDPPKSLKPDINSKSYTANVDLPGIGSLTFLPIDDYTDSVVKDDKYGANTHLYTNKSGDKDFVKITVVDGINDIGGAAASFNIGDTLVTLYGSKENDEYNKALYINENNMFVVIESNKGYDQKTWEKIVEGVVTND